MIPTESIFVTSSYVNVPPTDTLPPTFKLPAITTPTSSPTNFDAVIIQALIF